MDPRAKKQASKQLTRNWKQVRQLLRFLGKNLTKWNLVKAIGILSDARKARFQRRRTPKYGSMNKGFTDQELEIFFGVIDEPKFHMLFSFQAIMGLRIGEAVKVNIKDINLRTRELRIFTEKSKKTDYLLIPSHFFDSVLQYIDTYKEDIARARGFLFFSFDQANKREETEPRVTTETARYYFHCYLVKAKLDEIYGYSSSPIPRPLYRLSPHSLRHYAITNFARKNNGNILLAAKFARHTEVSTTMIYIHSEKNELYTGIERAQDDRLIKRIREMQEKVE